MIKLKNIIEIIQLIYKSKQKKYLVISANGLIECETYEDAKKKGVNMIKLGVVNSVRIAIEITSTESIVEIKK